VRSRCVGQVYAHQRWQTQNIASSVRTLTFVSTKLDCDGFSSSTSSSVRLTQFSWSSTERRRGQSQNARHLPRPLGVTYRRFGAQIGTDRRCSDPIGNRQDPRRRPTHNVRSVIRSPGYRRCATSAPIECSILPSAAVDLQPPTAPGITCEQQPITVRRSSGGFGHSAERGRRFRSGSCRVSCFDGVSVVWGSLFRSVV